MILLTSIASVISDTAWVGAVGSIIGSIVTYLIQKGKNQKELELDNRDHQAQLILELREMMSEQKEEMNRLRMEHKIEIEGLKSEIVKLQNVNMKLTFENKELQSQVKILTETMNKNKAKDDER